VQMAPGSGQTIMHQNGKQAIQIDPQAGCYDVRVVAGQAFTTQREEAAAGIQQILQAMPAFAPVLAPALMKLQDWPDADKYARMLLAMAPPAVQAAADDGEGQPQVPPALMAQVQELQQQNQALHQALGAADKALQAAQQEQSNRDDKTAIEAHKMSIDAQEAQESLEIERYNAETARMAALAKQLDPTSIAPVVQQLVQEALANNIEDDAGDEPAPIHPEIAKALQGLGESMSQLAQAHAKPKSVVRGPDGRIVGIQ
jgi:hypothetical protein